MKTRVRQIYSRGGNPAPNQFIIYTPEGTYFQSYTSPIAFRAPHGKIQLDEDTWNYSRTPGKYRTEFLGDSNDITNYTILSA